jgi:hypothetical protein
VNPETVALIERPYLEIVDDLLTAIVGGVVNEPIFFDVKALTYPLAQRASAIRGITGTHGDVVNGAYRPLHHTFQLGIDFEFDEGANSVVWQPGGLWPDDETLFYVDYFRPARPNNGSQLSDINVGSVTRTLSEAIGREIAILYQQINQTYLAGFIDTATGQALDLVVAILDIHRKTKEYAGGQVAFFRDTAAGDGNITIPAEILLRTEDGSATFVTTELRTLQRGQVRIDVPIRATDASKGPDGRKPAGTITTLAQGITGISRVVNLEATSLGQDDETDAELRARARAKLQGLGKGTLPALIQAVFSARGQVAEIWDPNGPPDKTAPPGTALLLVESEPERFPALRAAVEETRAAGVLVTLVARYIFFKPRMVVRITPHLAPAGKLKILDQIIAALQAYVDSLTAGQPAQGKELLAAVKKVKDVSDVRIVDVRSWRSDLDRPGIEELVDALATAVTATLAGDPAAMRAALTATLTATAPTTPTGGRTVDRSLVQGPGGQRVADSEIEAGTFQVTPPAGDTAQWWVVLDIEPADIVLQES